jgi:NAD(P)-dependent dehydrogenase (short-subunit alcohol dehydrogenase family)
VPEFGASGITVNLIEPGLVTTPLTSAMTGTGARALPLDPYRRHLTAQRVGVTEGYPVDRASTIRPARTASSI